MSAHRPNRNQRQTRQLIECWEAQARLSTAIAAAQGKQHGVDNGIAVIEPAELAALLRSDRAAAWQRLATLTSEQLVIEAIDLACYIERVEKREVAWATLLEWFEDQVAELMMKQVA